MKLTNVGKYTDIIITTIQTFAIILFASIITVFQCGFDFEKFDWLNFSLNFIFTTSMKVSYTVFSKNRELKTSDIVLLRNTIAADRKAVYDAQKNKEFEMEVERRNKISKLEALISKLDNKNHKNVKLREKNRKLRDWAFDYKKALIEKKDFSEFEKIRSLESIKNINYEKVEASKLFSFGQNGKQRKKKYVFNSFTTSLNRAVLPIISTFILSVVFSTIKSEGNISDYQLWIDLISYLFSISIGAWWGLSNGKCIIQEDYSEILNNVANYVREVATEIGVVSSKKEDKEN